MSYLEDALRELAEARAAEEGSRRLAAALEVALDSTPEGIALAKVREELSQKQGAIKAAEAKVRELALAEHALSGDTKPAEGVQVKLYSKALYDSQDVWSWCIVNAHKYLALDTKAFEKAAPVLRDLGCPVELTREPRVSIGTDLSAWLTSEGD